MMSSISTSKRPLYQKGDILEVVVTKGAFLDEGRKTGYRDPISFLNPHDTAFISPPDKDPDYWSDNNLKPGQKIRVEVKRIKKGGKRINYHVTLIDEDYSPVPKREIIPIKRNEPINMEDEIQIKYGNKKPSLDDLAKIENKWK